jgi:endonuclease YncB( thermonuclease family)
MTAKDSWKFMYRAEWERTVDGDTIVLRLDQGMHVQRVERCRLARVNCPEISTSSGRDAEEFTAAWFTESNIGWREEDWPLSVETHKADDYGRWLVEVVRRSDGRNLADDLLAAGHAEPWPKVKG